MGGLYKIFGLLDLVAVITLILLHYDFAPWRLGLAFSLYLIFKAFAFHGSIHSMIDAVIGGYMIILLFGVTSIFTFIAAAYLLQKVAFSFIG